MHTTSKDLSCLVFAECVYSYMFVMILIALGRSLFVPYWHLGGRLAAKSTRSNGHQFKYIYTRNWPNCLVNTMSMQQLVTDWVHYRRTRAGHVSRCSAERVVHIACWWLLWSGNHLMQGAWVQSRCAHSCAFRVDGNQGRWFRACKETLRLLMGALLVEYIESLKKMPACVQLSTLALSAFVCCTLSYLSVAD